MTNKFLAFAFLMTTALFFTACDPDDPEPPNPEELITTLNYILTPMSGGDVITLSFQDLDGDGGDTPIIVGGTLAQNEIYTGRLEILNEAESPVEDITVEILDEDEEHQFFFESTVSGLTITYEDEDADGNPVGLSSQLSTGVESSGSITITLIHEPMKTEEGVAEGDITNAAGEIDIEVTFPISVQ